MLYYVTKHFVLTIKHRSCNDERKYM